jgi:soluble lytic murein transglycosylase-like protein
MSRARTNQDDDWQTAAAPEIHGSGCLSGFIIPPLMVLLVGALLALFAFSTSARGIPMQTPALGSLKISQIFTPQVQYWNASISRWANASGLDPNLVAVIMQIESCGNPYARSGAGAIGLFQVMPDHFLPIDDPTAPDTNAARGLDYLGRSLSAAGNDVRLALAGYNGGIGLISSGEWSWPAETVRYAYWGSGIYSDAVSGAPHSSRLDEWLSAGGSSLCSQAGQILGIDK